MTKPSLSREVSRVPSPSGHLKPEPSWMYDDCHRRPTRRQEAGHEDVVIFVPALGQASPWTPASIRRLALSCARLVNPSDAIGVPQPPPVDVSHDT